MRIVILLLLLVSPFAAARAGETWTGRCVGVFDGGAIDVERADGTFPVRIYGVDCPKRGQDFFQESARNTHALAFRKVVAVEPVTRDAEGVVVGLVTVDGQPLTNMILESGMGAVSREFCGGTNLCLDWRRLEARAIRDGRGIWASKAAGAANGSDKLRRIEAKAGKILDEVQKARNDIAGIKEEKPPAPRRPESGFVGTPRTKKLHRITCRNAKVAEKEFFPTVNAGLEAGYSLCKLCEPIPGARKAEK